MAKKCIPGFFCIEKTTLVFLFIVLLAAIAYLIYQQHNSSNIILVQPPANPTTLLVRGDHDDMSPPVNKTLLAPNQLSPPIRTGVSAGYPRDYRQAGILTKQRQGNDGGEPLILPLYGRRVRSDKLQYYTIAEGGAKLPVSRNGRSCTGEYGCDEVSNGDTVYVEGYGDIFKATIYESGQYSYDPTII
jgi:hypothetical protein